MKRNFYVVVGTSKAGNRYSSIVLDLGYRKLFLSSRGDNNTTLCAEVLCVDVSTFLTYKDGIYNIEEVK